MRKRKIWGALLATLLVLTMLSGCVNQGDNPTDEPKPSTTEPARTEPTTEPVTEPSAESTEPQSSEPEPSETEPSETEPSETEPPATEPSEPLPPETQPSEPEYVGNSFTREELEAMDTTVRGYGPGVNVDDANRPYGAINEQQKYGQYDAYFIAPDDGNIYLTFDEGYENGYTSQILDVLKEKDVKAVFFVTMHYCKSNPELVQRMIDEGHTVGNHSVSHKSMPTLDIDTMVSEVMGLHAYVLENFGYEMHLFRPPMGEYSQQSFAVLQSLGYKTIEWSFAYYDYDPENQPEYDTALNKVVGAAHSGAIYLLHAVSKTNTEILGEVIDQFRGQGYNLVLFS